MGCLDEFLRSYKGNKTVPKTVGEKPCKPKRKSLGNCLQRTEIEVVVDSLVTSASTNVLTNDYCSQVSPVAVTASCGSGQHLISGTCSQILQLNVNPSPTSTSTVTVPVQMMSTTHTQSRVGSTELFQLKFLTVLIKIICWM